MDDEQKVIGAGVPGADTRPRTVPEEDFKFFSECITFQVRGRTEQEVLEKGEQLVRAITDTDLFEFVVRTQAQTLLMVVGGTVGGSAEEDEENATKH